MAEWGKESDHDLHQRLRKQAGAVRGRGPSSLARDHAYYAERAADATLPARERALWVQLRDELAKRLGLDAPESVQEELL